MIDFFNPRCQTPGITQTKFGLCDDMPQQAAYVDFADKTKWIATVKNERPYAVTFTAIDKCVMQDHEEIGRGRCDCMLTTDRHLYLIELKEREEDWISGAIAQLSSTIRFLKDNHDISAYKLKKVFACNGKRGKFVAFDNDENMAFYRETGFRKDVQAEIVVI